MLSKPKTSCYKTTPIERALVWAYYLNGLLYSRIKLLTGIPKSMDKVYLVRYKYVVDYMWEWMC